MIAQDAGLAAGIKTYADEITKDIKGITHVSVSDGVKVIDTPSANATTGGESPIQWNGDADVWEQIYNNQITTKINNWLDELGATLAGFFSGVGKAFSITSLLVVLLGVLILNKLLK